MKFYTAIIIVLAIALNLSAAPYRNQPVQGLTIT